MRPLTLVMPLCDVEEGNLLGVPASNVQPTVRLDIGYVIRGYELAIK